MTDPHRHPVNRQLLDRAPLGARIADRVTAFLGSWRFIVLQTVIVAIWIAVNVYHVLNAASIRTRSSCSTSHSRPRPPTQRR